MRVKKKKHTDERLSMCSELVVENLMSGQGNPQSFFDNGNPVRIEIGCGKGDFIVGTAMRNPDINFIAVEKISDVMVMAAEKVKKAELSNVRFCCCDAKELGEAFESGSIDMIYLNFSDPWPKARHYKRRLTYRVFLEMYKKLLRDEGSIVLKTDNRPLFDFSLDEFEAEDFELRCLTYDLHNSEYMKENVMTEYERRFSQMGIPINRVVATKK